MKTRTILYVEDNPLDIELTLQVFKENRIANQIVIARDGVEALEFLNMEGIFKARPVGNPGLILLDLKMPRMDGLELLDIVKKDDRYKGIPIVMLTSSKDESNLIKSYNLGVNSYVVKPLEFSDFVNIVKEIAVFWAIINEVPNEF